MADLHIHSTLSPCGSLEMAPKAIVNKAKEKGINLIAVTDHNSFENAYYVEKAAKSAEIFAFYGMEVQSREEVHVLAIFDIYDKLEAFGKIVYENLPFVPNNPEFFGDQVVVDENDEIIRFEEKLLINSVSLSLEEVVDLIKEHDGLAILSHVNASHFSIISQLGFVPEGLKVDALEVKYDTKPEEIESLGIYKNYPVITSSDAHYLKDIGRGYTIFEMEKPTLVEIRKALSRLENRNYSAFGKHGRIL
ncbi:MAG: PHP domain-containing protein [Candidatus Hydrothermia bacterium]